MGKQTVQVKCFFPEKGDDLPVLILQCFRLFLRQELENSGHKLVSSNPSGIKYSL